MKFFFHDLEVFISKSIEVFQEARCVSWNITQFVHTIQFHSYDYDNVSLIERINNFHFSCHRYYSFKSCLKILKKICLGETMVKNRLRASAYQNIFQELRLKDKQGTLT